MIGPLLLSVVLPFCVPIAQAAQTGALGENVRNILVVWKATRINDEFAYEHCEKEFAFVYQAFETGIDSKIVGPLSRKIELSLFGLTEDTGPLEEISVQPAFSLAELFVANFGNRSFAKLDDVDLTGWVLSQHNWLHVATIQVEYFVESLYRIRSGEQFKDYELYRHLVLIDLVECLNDTLPSTMYPHIHEAYVSVRESCVIEWSRSMISFYLHALRDPVLQKPFVMRDVDNSFVEKYYFVGVENCHA